MTENTMNKTSDTPATDLPPAPNGHGASNGFKDTPPSSKKKKRNQPNKTRTSASGASDASATTDQDTLNEPAAPIDPQPPIEEPAAAATATIEASAESLRLRMKVWTDPTTAKRYLMPTAFMRDVVNGHPISDIMYAYAMSDDDTKRVTLTAAEWNALPFFYFQEDGPAPRSATRPVDDVGAAP